MQSTISYEFLSTSWTLSWVLQQIFLYFFTLWDPQILNEVADKRLLSPNARCMKPITLKLVRTLFLAIWWTKSSYLFKCWISCQGLNIKIPTQLFLGCQRSVGDERISSKKMSAKGEESFMHPLSWQLCCRGTWSDDVTTKVLLWIIL